MVLLMVVCTYHSDRLWTKRGIAVRYAAAPVRSPRIGVTLTWAAIHCAAGETVLIDSVDGRSAWRKASDSLYFTRRAARFSAAPVDDPISRTATSPTPRARTVIWQSLSTPPLGPFRSIKYTDVSSIRSPKVSRANCMRVE